MKMAESTDIIAKILELAGVRDVIVSSGSRSLRMVRAAVDNEALNVCMIIDERVAAFFALGICECTTRPVALICTSGSAMLNYAPAVAEAYYRGTPLIIVTADRPKALIDINDGQTIHQSGALDNIVKCAVDIDATRQCSNSDYKEIFRCVVDAITSRKGPVHINLHLEDGVKTVESNKISDICPDFFVTDIEQESSSGGDIYFENLGNKRILVFIGQMDPDEELDKTVENLAKLNNVVIVSDIVSNCRAQGVISDIESIIGKVIENTLTYRPDILITLGKTSPISRRFKEWLRNINGYRHWRVNDTDVEEDTYFHLEKTIVTADAIFLEALARNISAGADMTYRNDWHKLHEKSTELKDKLIAGAPWSDISAIGRIIKAMPKTYTIHSSNGLSIRYLSMTGTGHRLLYCNRGVNGIDGSTSTAIGYSSASPTPTLLITGDMSAIYDISALFSGQATSQFRMIVMANGGGEIFRNIKATREYENREEMLCKIPAVQWKYVAKSTGFDYHEANDAEQLNSVLNIFFTDTGHPQLLIVNTLPGNSEIYTNIINQINDNL